MYGSARLSPSIQVSFLITLWCTPLFSIFAPLANYMCDPRGRPRARAALFIAFALALAPGPAAICG